MADQTAEIAEETAIRRSLEYRRVVEPEPGKHRALNTALATVTTPLVVSVDADTFLHRDALTYLLARITSRPQDQHTCASAGGVVVLNGPDNLLTRMQDWDYRLGINGVKRMQAAYNSALVAQGRLHARVPGAECGGVATRLRRVRRELGPPLGIVRRSAVPR